ncbi:unnamed protein product, partial [Brenthis ino]
MLNDFNSWQLLNTCTLVFTYGYEKSDIISARIESCRGCSLNRLPEVKKFIMNDAPDYDRVEVKFINGMPPELVIIGEDEKELERIPLSNLDREDCNIQLKSRGFEKKNTKEEF